METKHTPEPWVADHRLIKSANEEVGFLNSEHDFEEAAANTKRIVECVNACAGIPSEILTSPNRKHDAFFEAIELEVKNKELIALFQELEHILSCGGTITQKSVIRGAILLVLGKDPNLVREAKEEEVRDLTASDYAKMKAHVGILSNTVSSLIQTLVTENPNAEFGPAVKEAKRSLEHVEEHRIERLDRRSNQ